jgi:hypothetical protein
VEVEVVESVRRVLDLGEKAAVEVEDAQSAVLDVDLAPGII